MLRRRLALGGVGEGALAPEHLSVQWREAVSCFRVEQAKKLQLVDVEVGDGPYRGKLSQHLKTQVLILTHSLVNLKFYTQIFIFIAPRRQDIASVLHSMVKNSGYAHLVEFVLVSALSVQTAL